ncbi:phosphopantetheine-binding protein [Streptomyces phaeochromogenes]|uniref:phosphopantetheine-binding protein n=1 Tax=Streptomyces phaeochromogenes TaxID=1923 RepID=UPI0036C59AFF
MWDDQFEKIVRQYLPFISAADELDPHTELRDLGLDSLGTIEMMAALESAYDMRFRDEALTLESFRTADVLWRTVSDTVGPTG